MTIEKNLFTTKVDISIDEMQSLPVLPAGVLAGLIKFLKDSFKWNLWLFSKDEDKIWKEQKNERSQ